MPRKQLLFVLMPPGYEVKLKKKVKITRISAPVGGHCCSTRVLQNERRRQTRMTESAHLTAWGKIEGLIGRAVRPLQNDTGAECYCLEHDMIMCSALNDVAALRLEMNMKDL